jgi:4-hydroxybenzoate polyprenyltransferase/phosphoserine phosphatase
MQLSHTVPLVVDLDGTLCKTDLLYESLCVLLKYRLWCLFVLPFWLYQGKAYLKQQIAQRVTLEINLLPYHTALLDYLTTQHTHGRRLVLATASDTKLAHDVAGFFGIFETVLASDGTTNLAATRKRDRLVALFGVKGFDYAGNSPRDLAVWSAAHQAIVVNAPQQVQAAVAQVAPVAQIFDDHAGGIRAYVRALRLHQWLKNLLVLVPLLTVRGGQQAALLPQALLAFVAFGLCASSVYVCNDLLDLNADRHHPHKRQRPFASGELTLSVGLGAIPILLGLSGLVCLFLPSAFLSMLALYYSVTLAYSLALKHNAPLDVLVLASLYTIRLLAGSAATGIWPSDWLLAFTSFLFLSLALVKRYAELVVVVQEVGETTARERDYRIDDRELLAAMGVTSGYLAVVIFALYLTHDLARRLFSHQDILWLWCPLLLYWISYVWLVAHRGGMSDDPIVFAIKDRISRVVMVLMALVLLVAL